LNTVGSFGMGDRHLDSPPFFLRRNKSKRRGLQNECRECSKETRKRLKIKHASEATIGCVAADCKSAALRANNTGSTPVVCTKFVL